MWFAALGSYQNNPWLLYLVYRLLHSQAMIHQADGSSKPAANAILDLIDRDKYPFQFSPPAQIRATVYDYDFSRWNTSWGAMTVDSSDDVIDTFGDQSKLSKWWTRRNPREYLPALDSKNPSLKEFIVQSVRHRSLGSIADRSVTEKYHDCVKMSGGSKAIRSFLEVNFIRVFLFMSSYLSSHYVYLLQEYMAKLIDLTTLEEMNPTTAICRCLFIRDYVENLPYGWIQKLVTPAAGEVVVPAAATIFIAVSLLAIVSGLKLV
jgi:hypothetical protein